ncbi:MAG: peptidylprolyl isomerase [Planctomycetes bacterium]|nr:peptidylprolyl isomerase [Planctomycetota bacterium]
MQAPAAAPAPEADEYFEKAVRGGLIAVGLAAALWIGWYFLQRTLKANQDAADSAAWSGFAQLESDRGVAQPAPVEGLDKSVQPWADLVRANQLLREGKRADARALVEKTATAGDSPAAKGLIPGASGASVLAQSVGALDQWEKEKAALTTNPKPPETGRVQIVTTAGTIVIGLYDSLAPKHVENFRKLLENKSLEGTRFHRIVKGATGGISIVQGGDPNSKEEGKPETWGQGSLGGSVPFEVNRLAHVRGAVAMAQPSGGMGAPTSSDCQFYIVTGPSHSLDRRYVVFGNVLEGMDVVDKIAESELEPGTERPKAPTMIVKVQAL